MLEAGGLCQSKGGGGGYLLCGVLEEGSYGKVRGGGLGLFAILRGFLQLVSEGECR